MDSPSDKELQPVDALADDLRSLAGARLLVPKRVDDAVLALARRQLHHRRRGRLAAGAAAAAILMAIGAVWLLSDKPLARPAPLAKGANGGHADVLDLLALALKAESHGPIEATGDLTYDSIVEGQDMHALARNIVRVSDVQDAQRLPEVRQDGRCTIDIYVDAGEQGLAAYQVEFRDPTGQLKIVGVEGGEPAAFKTPPIYDPAALGRARIILAAYSTDRDLPTGRVRVARLHVMSAQPEPNYVLRLCTAGTSDGIKVPARFFMAQQRNELNRRGPSPQGAGQGAVGDVALTRAVEIFGRV